MVAQGSRAHPGVATLQVKRELPIRLEMERLQEHSIETKAVRAGELRAPLDSMIAYLDLLLEEDLSEREARQVIEVVHGGATRLRQMVQDSERLTPPPHSDR
jgi:signal transduction histidine kinase